MNHRCDRIITLIVNLLVAVVTLSSMGIFARPAYAQTDEAAWLLGQINALRARNGIAPLTVNAHLVVSATQHSNYLANNPYTDPHVEANGSRPRDRIAAAGYTGVVVGENVVGGMMATVEWAFQWWVNEPIHYRNMLANWTEIGIGIASGPYGHWYTTDFGIGTGDAPAPPAPAANDNNVAQQGGTPPPTHRPATRVPTLTPSLTLTPSITFTARPTFTPTFTATSRPPTSTAIYLEVSPQPSGSPPPPAPQMVAQVSSPTAPPAPAQPIAADVASPPTDPSDGIRRLIPWAIGLQAVIIGGFFLRSLRRRGSH